MQWKLALTLKRLLSTTIQYKPLFKQELCRVNRFRLMLEHLYLPFILPRVT